MEPKASPGTPMNPKALTSHDRVILEELQLICDRAANGNDGLAAAWHGLDTLNLQIGQKNRPTRALRAGIIGMIRTRHVNYSLAMAILDRVYMQRKRYDEMYEVCGDLLDLDKKEGQQAVKSVLVEYIINCTISRIITGQDPGAHRSLAPKFLDLLEKRASSLDIEIDTRKGKADEFQRALDISRDIYAKRYLEPAITLEPWLKSHYPHLYKFLGLSPKKIINLLKRRADIVYCASAAMSSQQKKNAQVDTLDTLESMVNIIESGSMTVHAKKDLSSWRDGLCERKFLQSALEMRLYVHLAAQTPEIELGPAMEAGKRADFRVRGCYIEAYTSRDVAAMEFGQMVHTNSRRRLLRKVLSKSQIGYFGSRQSLLIIEDPRNYVDDVDFLGELSARIGSNERLGGVLIARDMGRHYRCALVKSPTSASPVHPPTMELVIKALETPYG